MKTTTEIHHQTRVRNTYTLAAISDRKTALQWIANTSTCLPFENKLIRCEDGRSFHDGTVSFVCSEIENPSEFITKHLNSPIYVIMISGDYQSQHMSVQIHLNLHQIYIGADATAEKQISEIEQLLELV